MKVSKDELCDSCRKIRPVMNDGSLGLSIEEWLECRGYEGLGWAMLNPDIKFYLEDNGGCPSCIRLFS